MFYSENGTFCIGEFVVAIPKGWMAFPISDGFGGAASAIKTNTIKLCKGAKTPFDLISKPLLEIVFYGETQGIMPPKMAYKNVTDLEPFVTGNHNWVGFQGNAFMGKELILLWEDTGELQYQVTLWTKGEDSSIDTTDDDVQTILSSITPV